MALVDKIRWRFCRATSAHNHRIAGSTRNTTFSTMRKPKTLAEQIAELEDPAPRGGCRRSPERTPLTRLDFDPEEHEDAPPSDESGSEAEEIGLDGREHYVNVGYAS